MATELIVERCAGIDVHQAHRRMLEALVAGTTDPEVLADLAKTRLRTKLPELRKALNARFRAHHGFLVSHILAHVDYLAIGVVSTRLDEALVPFQPAIAVLVSVPGFSVARTRS